MNKRNSAKLLYPELSYQITGILFRIHNELSRFCKEKQYADLFEKFLIEEKINYIREEFIPFQSGIGGNKIDFLIEGKILVEIKAKKFLLKNDYYQVKRYLKALRVELALLVNFRDVYLKPKRILNKI